MECLRCGANLKDNALVCKKCGFIVKGSKKVENVEPPISFEEKINNASAEELRAMIFAYKKAQEAPKESKKAAKKEALIAAAAEKAVRREAQLKMEAEAAERKAKAAAEAAAAEAAEEAADAE